MKKFLLLCALWPAFIVAQNVTDAQYEAANKAIVAEATYRISTFHNGLRESTTRYYLTDDGRLTDAIASAGRFTFHRIDDGDLYRSPGWQFDQFFTNPDCAGGSTDAMYHFGYIRSNIDRSDLQRENWEGQLWYKQGDTYAVRATNSPYDSWGANSFWTVVSDMDGDGLPNADYSLTPLFTWRLEKIADPAPPVDPSVKQVQRVSNLPHVYIDTFNGRAISSKTSYVYARMWYVDENDQVTFYDSLQIRGRGNSTWGLAKKPYKLKFHEKQKLLGKGYANTKKWTLLANHGDKTLIRNALTSLMGERAGLKFNPAAKFVDLTINNNFVGNYQLSDQVDVRPHRVNITEQDYPLTDASDITGGYLFEADGSGDFHTSEYWDNESQAMLPPDGFYTSRASVPMRIHYPEADELDQRQIDFAKDFLRQFEERLFSSDFDHPTKGYREYVDSMSLANWYLCTEISGNVDGMYSTYFYKEQQDNHIFWGPLWDYDIAYNNDNRTRVGTNDTERQLMRDASYGNVTSWVQRMWQDSWFTSLVGRRYSQLIDEGMEDYLYACIDSLTALLDASQQLNYKRWGIDNMTLRERVIYSTYDEYVADLRTYINRHLSFLSEVFDPYKPQPEPEPKQPDFPADPAYYYAISNSGSGTFVDVDGSSDALVCNARVEEAESQQWQIFPLANGYLYVVNRATGYALCDPTEGEPTATTLTGTQLTTAARPDSTDVRQQWDFVAQSDGRYNLVNRFSQHAANLSGGNPADGTPVLSYTSDDRNATSGNRLWRIEVVGSVPTDPTTDVERLDVDYALAFDPQSARLHFGADDLSALAFEVRVYDSNGRLLRRFRASEGTSLAGLPHGLYLVTWTWQGRQRTVKLTY